MSILLDTCTFLWITLGSAPLSALARRFFSDPDNHVFLSVVSAWEISVKFGLGRLPLPTPPQQFVPQQRRLHRIRRLALYEAASLYEPNLPRLHKDPFDRMLVCQAIVHDLVILTPDPLIQQYSAQTAW